MKQFILFLLCVFGAVTLSHAQATWEIFDTTNSGLPHQDVRAIAVDQTGNKWVGTWGGGLAMFNDTSWTIYDTTNSGLPGNNITVIKVDHLNNVWMAVGASVVKFDGTNWTVYNSGNSLLTGATVNDIEFSGTGELWVGSLNAVLSFDGFVWQIYNNQNSVIPYAFKIVRTAGVEMYAGADSLYKFNGSWTTKASSLPISTSTNGVTEIAIDKIHQKWIHKWRQITIFGVTNNLHETFIVDDLDANYVDFTPQFNKTIKEIVVDDLDIKWFATTNGVHRYANLIFQSFDTSNSPLPSNLTQHITIDLQGNKWIGTNQGLAKYADGGAGPIIYSTTASQYITGQVFNDNNSNGIKDSLEVGVNGQIIELLPGPIYATSNAMGEYYFAVDTGTYTINYYPGVNWSQTSLPASHTVTISTGNPNQTGVDFGTAPIANVEDLSVTLTASIARCNWDQNQWINYKNQGATVQNGTITYEYDSLLTFVSATVPPTSHVGNTVTWNFANLLPMQQRQIKLTMHVPNLIGQALSSEVSIPFIAWETDSTNNSALNQQTIVCSYDPNDKLVTPEGLQPGNLILQEQTLQYTVRFQNTGTDTAFVVVIQDTLDANLYVPSFQFLAASHPMEYSISGSGNLTFTFDNILLPDSHVNEPLSQGFLKYSIRAKPSLPDSTQIFNKASIYFDANAPIVTNEVYNTVVTSFPSSENNILTFNFPQQSAPAAIDTAAKTVAISVPFGTNITALQPAITVSFGATVSPASGVAQDFTSPVAYTVTAENGDVQVWTVSVTVEQNSANDVLTFSIPQQVTPAVINPQDHTVAVSVPYGTDVTALVPTITVSAGANLSPASGVAQDFTTPVAYSVTAENGDAQIWTVTVQAEPNSANDVHSFSIPQQVASAVIKPQDHTVVVTVPYGTVVTALVPVITVSAGATVSPASGVAQDFTTPVAYSVTAENGDAQVWTVIVDVLSGIKEGSTSESRIFPNPARDFIYVEAQIGSSFKVFDIYGKELISVVVQETTEPVSLEKLKNGLYFFQIISAEGSTWSGKFQKL